MLGINALSHDCFMPEIMTVCGYRVSDSGVRHIIDGSSKAQLRELNFTNLIKLSDVTLLRISQT